MTHDQHDVGGFALEQLAIGGRVAPPGVVEALAAGKRVGPSVRLLPQAVVVDRLALEVADIDIVEQRLGLEGDIATLERDLRRLERPGEPRVDAEADRNVRDLLPEGLRVLPALLREAGYRG